MTWNNLHFRTLEIDIASNARVSEFLPLAVPALMLSESHTLPRTRRSCFVIFRFMARGQSPITIVSFCSFGSVSSAVYTYYVMAKLSKFRLSSVSRQATWDRLHWNYIFISNSSYWKARQLASEIVAALSEQNISQASYFENSLFRIKQLTILFAAQKFCLFLVIPFYIAMQSIQSNCNSVVLLRGDFANIFITPPSWWAPRSTDAVVQLVDSFDFTSVGRLDKQLSLLYDWHLQNVQQTKYLFSTTFVGTNSDCDVINALCLKPVITCRFFLMCFDNEINTTYKDKQTCLSELRSAGITSIRNKLIGTDFSQRISPL